MSDKRKENQEEEKNKSNVVSLAAFREAREKMGVQKRGEKWEVAVDSGERYPNGRKKYYREGGFDGPEKAKSREEELCKLFHFGQLGQPLQKLHQLHPVEVIDTKKTLFSDIAKKWLDQKKNEIRFLSWQRYKDILSNHILPFFQNTYIEELKKKDIQNYYDKKVKDCRQSLNKHRAIINGIFSLAEKKEIIEDNITLLVKMPPAKKPLKRWIEVAEELRCFVNSFKGSCLFVPVYIAAATGMRMSEILSLTWQDINFKYGYIKIWRTQHYHTENGGSYTEDPKTDKSARTIYLTQNGLRILENIKLERQAKNSDYICLNSNGEVFRNNTLSTNFRRAARTKKRGGYNLSFKSLRSSYATIMRDMGVDETAIQEDLGHAQLTTTQGHYFKTTAKQRKKLREAKEEMLKDL